MTLTIPIPGGEDLRLEHLMLDVNGTLTGRGALLDGVTARVRGLRPALDVHLVSADTFGTLDSIAELLLPTALIPEPKLPPQREWKTERPQPQLNFGE